MKSLKLRYKKITENAFDPEFANPTDIGFDIRTPDNFSICPNEIKIIPTGLVFDIPDEYELQIRPKSGLAAKGLSVVNTPGTIDPLYKKEIMVILINHGDKILFFEPGNKICQGVIKERIFVTFEEADEIIDTNRGGLGSTGK